MDEFWVFQLIGSCIIVTAFAMLGFNQPSWARTYMTIGRYCCAGALHALAYLLTMAIIYAAIRKVTGMTSDEALSLATLITIVLRAITPVSRRLRTAMHSFAGVPDGARRFAQALTGEKFEPPAEVLEDAKQLLRYRGVDASCGLEIALPLSNLLTKATALFIQLRQWDEDSSYGGFAAEARNELRAMRQRFDQMANRAVRTMQMIETLGEMSHLHMRDRPGDDTGERLDELTRMTVSDLIENSCEEIEAFNEDAALLAARAALTLRWTRFGRDKLVSDLGFRHAGDRGRHPYGVLAVTLVLVYCGMWLYFSLIPGADSSLPARARIALVTIIVFGAMAIAILPKLRFAFANAGLFERTPVHFVVGAGAAAMLYALIVNFLAGFALIGGFEGGIARLREGLPYLPAAFCTAAAVAALVQDHRWRGTRNASLRRTWDALTLGGVWVAASAMAVVLKRAMEMPGSGEAMDPASLIYTLVFGAVLGCAIPESIRVRELYAERRPLVPRPAVAYDEAAVGATPT